MVRFAAASLGILILLAAPISAQADDDLWFHVSVDGTGDEPERVRVNLPLRLIETALPLIEVDEFHGGKVQIDDCDLDHEDLVAILRAVNEAKDGEYVTVEDDDEYVRVAKEGKHILVKVEERHGDGDHVDIRVPVQVLDALVSGDDDELDVLAAIKALGKHAKGDLVTVTEDDGTAVRIWVDAKNESD